MNCRPVLPTLVLVRSWAGETRPLKSGLDIFWSQWLKLDELICPEKVWWYLISSITCVRSVETGHLDGVFMHKKAQKLKFLCERNDKVSLYQHWSGRLMFHMNFKGMDLKQNINIFPFRYSSPAPRVGPRAKSTSWRSTNPGWPTGRGWPWCPRLEKVQYLRKWPKSDPSCSGLESGHLFSALESPSKA